jgi:hypothetical protein
MFEREGILTRWFLRVGGTNQRQADQTKQADATEGYATEGHGKLCFRMKMINGDCGRLSPQITR